MLSLHLPQPLPMHLSLSRTEHVVQALGPLFASMRNVFVDLSGLKGLIAD